MPYDTPTKAFARTKKMTAAERVEDDIRFRVLSGRYRRGALLPGRRALADEYEVGPLTIELAVKKLVDDGILRSENGRGTFVADGAPVEAPETTFGTNAEKSSRLLLGNTVVGIIAHVNEDECALSPGHTSPAMEIVRALERTFGANGGSATFFNMWKAFGTGIGSAGAVKHVISLNVDVIVFIDIYDNQTGLAELRLLPEIGTLPIVYVSGVDYYIPCSHIHINNRDAGYKATDSLCKAGYRDIVFHAPFTERWVEERIEGARTACESQAATVSFRVSPTERNQGYDDSVRQYSQDSQRPIRSEEFIGRGIVAANDFLALDLMASLEAAGLCAGSDYGLVGFDDEPLAIIKGLTTVKRPLQEMGESAAFAALKIVEGAQSNIVQNMRSSITLRKSHCRRIREEASL